MIIQGKVIKGRGIGRSLGYPTANLQCEIAPDIALGVYAARVKIGDEVKNVVVIIGALRQNQPSIEVHILDWQGDLYGVVLEVEILKQISEIEKFISREALVKKIEGDVARVREYFSLSLRGRP